MRSRRPRRLVRVRSSRSSNWARRRSSSRSRRSGGRKRQNAELEIERLVVVAHRLGVEQLLEELLAAVGDGVDLAGAGGAGLAPPAGRGRRRPPGPEGGRLAGEGAGHRDGWAGRLRLDVGHGRVDRPHRARRLQTVEGGVERAEGDAREGPEGLREPLLQFVPVQLLFLQQPQDGQLQQRNAFHTSRWSDISVRYIDRSMARPQSSATAPRPWTSGRRKRGRSLPLAAVRRP